MAARLCRFWSCLKHHQVFETSEVLNTFFLLIVDLFFNLLYTTYCIIYFNFNREFYMPEIFGLEHLIFILIWLVCCISVIISFIKIKSKKYRDSVIKILASVLLICILANRFSVAFIKYNDWRELIFNTFCGFSSFSLAISVLFSKRLSWYYHIVCPLGFVGAVITMVYPDFIGQSDSVFYLPTITGLVHHALMILIIILLIIDGKYVPTLKKLHYLIIGLCCLVTLGKLEIDILHLDDAFYLNKPLLAGTIFTWYFTGFLFILISAFILLIFDLINKNRAVR